MSTWDAEIFTEDVNEEFLDELNDLDAGETVEAIRDACLFALRQENVSVDERLNGLAAATVAAIWAGAPFSTGEVADAHPFIRQLIGQGPEDLNEAAAELLETVETDADLEPFLEALA